MHITKNRSSRVDVVLQNEFPITRRAIYSLDLLVEAALVANCQDGSVSSRLLLALVVLALFGADS